MRAIVLTVSSTVARDGIGDESGPALAAQLDRSGADVIGVEVLPDDFALIEDRLRHYVDEEVDVILTTGGTGLTADDVTPEATRAVIERDVPGFAEAMRAESLRHTPLGLLTRGESGTAGRSLIINFPGSPRAIDQLFPVVAPALEHAVATLRRGPGQGARDLHG